MALDDGWLTMENLKQALWKQRLAVAGHTRKRTSCQACREDKPCDRLNNARLIVYALEYLEDNG